MTGINLHANSNHIAQEDIVLWYYSSTSSVVTSKNCFKDSGIRLLPGKKVGNTVPQSLQRCRTEDWVARWNIFPFKDNYLCHVWMTLSVITFSQIYVKLLM